LFIVPVEQYQSAIDIALQILPCCSPTTNSHGRLGKLAQWYAVPDQPVGAGDRHATLLLLNTQLVPIDLSRIDFHPLCNIWRPNLIEALRSYIHVVCMYAEADNITANNSVRIWISEFVLYTICGVMDIPKCETEDDV